MQNNSALYTLITGASEGIGKALAIECASRGMNLVLAALPGPELHQLASYIRKNFSVEVEEMHTDLSIEANCHRLWQSINEKELGINMLINNAGIGSSTLFGEGNLQSYQQQVRLNVMNTMMLTHLFLPNLKKNKHSYILNISSLSIFFFPPGKQVYGATKSFIYFFSKSLRRELEKDGISVSVLCPGGINSNPSQYFITHTGTWIGRWSVMNPEEIAKPAIDGLLHGKETIIPGKWNHIFLLLDKILPGWLKKLMTEKQMKSIRPGINDFLINGKSVNHKKAA